MEHYHSDAHNCFQYLLQCNGIPKKTIQQYLAKQMWSPSDRMELLLTFSNMLWKVERMACLNICKAFGPLTVDLLLRCSSCINEQHGITLESVDQHERICVLLGWLTSLSLPNLDDFCFHYLSKFGTPFKRILWLKEMENSKQKKRKKLSAKHFDDILEATWRLLDKYPVILCWNWHWSFVLDCLNKDFQVTDDGKYFLRKILATISFHTEKQSLDSFSNTKLEIYCQPAIFDDGLNDCKSLQVTSGGKVLTHVEHAFVSADLSPFLAPVCGVLLLKAQLATSVDIDPAVYTKLVMTEQCQTSLQKLALSVAERRAVLLEGPTGCGKTALVEYLAYKTGHVGAPYLTKIQLSDDTDSKTLTGTYTCTSVPGEFAWQAGLLVEACLKGYWILLEDVDRAPMDIISLLLPLIECRQLNIPGRSAETNIVSSQFRLFMTRRTSTNGSSRNTGMEMLSRIATVLELGHIPNTDMEQIMLIHYPNLKKVSQKLLKIYQKVQCQVLASSQRTPSTRDLLKWCHRVSDKTTVEGISNIGNFVAMSAIDCFAASLANCNTRLSMAEIICCELNISTDKAEYFCNTYKPNIVNSASTFSVGRANLQCTKSEKLASMSAKRQPFAETRHSCVLLERVACCIERNEPVLLVGETGVGKTSALQYLAQETGRRLHVVNMSQQSSSSDLLGGYKPAQISHFVIPLLDSFELLFGKTFSINQNKKFLNHIHNCMHHKRYSDLVQLMTHSSKAAVKKLKTSGDNKEILRKWKDFCTDLHDLKTKLKLNTPIAFDFVEGKLSKCIQKGDWILLDEINLAALDTLECLSSVLESDVGSIMLMERGDAKPVTRHHEFRIFAAMNPATDVGKRNLPDGIRNRFTEVFVDEPENFNDLSIIVGYYLKNRSASGSGIVGGIVKFYQDVRRLAKDKLVDGSGHKPHYSLRTLCRALQYVSDNTNMSLHKALYEGFHLAFLTTLDASSQPRVESLIIKSIVGTKNYKTVKSQICPKPTVPSTCVGNFHVTLGPFIPADDPHYIITPSVNKNLQNLARPVSYGKYPVLIQGETSTGKTSLIKYLSALSGNKVVRINNHEHTDLQEYIGSYCSNTDGKLVFQDGPLVTAMREGHWVILDELNLAPTDILEALNRVLDDNREIFITETQEVVKAHPRFQLFATQNPPGLYGGRKILSRAFRNRFIELHFNEIPSEELITILHKRCHLSLKHCRKLVKIMIELQSRRRSSGLFAGKHGYITLRDLFKWAERYRKYEADTDKFFDWDQYLANDGFLLLAGRVRKKEEEKVIEEVISKHLCRNINISQLFKLDETVASICAACPQFSHVVWTEPMRRLYITLERALRFDEPVLLVGETGGGKTTACQMVSTILKKKLAMINCHANTEAADFIGGLRPVRCSVTDEDKVKTGKLFEWVDGPLVESMTHGSHLLVDEISLADDSVLERLNSVLEPERCLVIPDKLSMNSKGKDESLIVAKSGFQFLATMNPGGDYGKKELSPALRNRMTEIWCDVAHEKSDLTNIVQHNLHVLSSTTGDFNQPKLYAELIVDFVNWFKSTLFGKRFVISVRDLLTWANFMSISCDYLDVATSYIHAACLVYIDGLGSGLSGGFASRSKEAHVECLKFVMKQLKVCNQLKSVAADTLNWLQNELNERNDQISETISSECIFGIGEFCIQKGEQEVPTNLQFTFNAHSTSNNALRVLRALQLPRPILLEGSPGGGKTSLVTAIAQASGHHIVRINLSEQTDASDLFGEDLPVENGVGGEFSWRDGPLLHALKAGHWVVLDELNLASQSVLESLNSVFDHRGEIYIPDLGQTFTVQHEKTRIFACQNPLHEGGGRKGLPKSFLNRFTQVHIQNLSNFDMEFILANKFPKVSLKVIKKMVEFNSQVQEQIVVDRSWAHLGSPWEFNLRDMTFWCSLVANDYENNMSENAAKHVYLIYCVRLRSCHDRKRMLDLFFKVFGCQAYRPSGNFYVTSEFVQFGNIVLNRNPDVSQVISPQYNIVASMLHAAESLASAINQNWPCILSGSSASGKSRLVKTVAALTGNNLRVLSTNSAMDAVELLGGYEQADKLKTVQSYLHQAKRNVMLSTSMYMKDEACKLLCFREVMKIADNLGDYIARLNLAYQEDNIEKILNNLSIELSKHVATLENTNYAHLIQTKELLENCISLLLNVQHKGTYEWIDSVLIEALRNGDWLLVDDANFCLPSVLDRLNALLEPNGILSVTERGMINGSIVEIKPHKNFRLIFVLNPAHGELSRAMRNRCIEIHLLEDNLNTSSDSYVSNEVEFLIMSQSCDSVEVEFCANLAKNLMNNKIAPLSQLENAKLLTKATEMLSMYRMGLDIPQPMLLDWHHPASQVRIPSVADFSLNPMLSMIKRQLRILDFLPQLVKLNNSNLQLVICCCLQILAENATTNDWKLRSAVVKEILPTLLQNIAEESSSSKQKLDYVSMFLNILEKVFLHQLNTESNIKDIPWDPRTNCQIREHFDISVDDVECRSKFLSIIHLMLNSEEVVHAASFSSDISQLSKSKRKKRKKVNLTCFSASKAIHCQAIQINDLPHPSLVYLYELYVQCTSLFGNLHQLSVVVKDDSAVMLCWQKLIEMSNIWRYFMESTFSLSAFTLYFSHLQSCLNAIQTSFGFTTENPFVDVLSLCTKVCAALQTPNKTMEKFGNKIRSLLSLTQPFSELENFMLFKAVRKLREKTLQFCRVVFDAQITTQVNWRQIMELMEKISLAEFSGADANEFFEFVAAMDKVDDCNEFFEELFQHFQLQCPPKKLCTFGVSMLDKQVWPMQHYLQINMMCSQLKASSSHFLSVCNSNLQPYKVVYQPDDKFHLHSSIETHIVNTVTNFSMPPSFKKSETEDKFSTGSVNFVMPSLTATLFPLLATDTISWKSGDIFCNMNLLLGTNLHPTSVPLRDFNVKANQLSCLQKELWSGAPSFVSLIYPGLCIGPFLNFAISAILDNIHKFMQAVLHDKNAEILYCDEKYSLACEKLAEVSKQFLQNVPLVDHRLKSLLSIFSSHTSPAKLSSNNAKWIQNICDHFCDVINSVAHVFHLISQTSSVNCFSCQQITKEMTNLQIETELTKCVGTTWVHFGFLGLFTMSPMGNIDPVKKYQTKFECLAEVFGRLNTDITVRDQFHYMLTNHPLVEQEEGATNLCSHAKNLVHPRTEATVQQINNLRSKLDKIKNKCAYRPSDDKFQQLHSVCKSFISSLGSYSSKQTVLNLLNDKKNFTIHNMTATKLKGSMSAFCAKLTDNFSEYPDMVCPVIDAVNQVLFGLGVVDGSSKIQHVQDTFVKNVGCCVETYLHNLLKNNSSICRSNIISESFEFRQNSSKFDIEFGKSFQLLPIKVLTVLLLDLYHQSFHNNKITKKNLLVVLQNVYLIWSQYQDTKEQKEEKTSSLYKYKPQVHEDDTLEDTEIQIMFPTFEEDGSCSANSAFTPSEKTDHSNESPLLEQLFELVPLVHVHVVKPQNKQVLRLNDVPVKNLYLPMVCAHYTAAGIISDVFPYVLGNQVDFLMWRNNVVLAAHLQTSFNTTNDCKASDINVYKDPLPSEACRCLPVLKEFQTYVEDYLLSAYPEHPVLIQIIVVIERVSSFSMNSPIMKFVHGLELLLEKAQEWECNASSELSICSHLEALTNLILDWRKLELRSWNQLLDGVVSSASKDTTKWWFFLYGLVHEYLQKRDTSCILEVVTSVQQFIESSSIAQFKDRMLLVQTFCHHLIFNGNRNSKLAVSFNNVYKYYAQFLASVGDRILSLRKPIEKQLKNFVKIAKWNDINFYSVKESIAKTHRTLFKLVKKFKLLLDEPLSLNVLKASSTSFGELQDNESKGLKICREWKMLDMSQSQLSSNFNDACNVLGKLDENLDLCDGSEKDVLARLPTVALKLCKHSLHLRQRANNWYLKCLANVEDITGDIIENFNTLRKLEPTIAQSKDDDLQKKRLSEAKHIQSRKRKALADLFKLLRSLGLSYRKGVIWKNNLATTEILLTPNPLNEMEQDFPGGINFHVLADDYFYRLMLRWTAMLAASHSPNKEVGLANIQRMTGFTNHLLKIAAKQRETLSELTNMHSSMNNFQYSLSKYQSATDSICLHQQFVVECLHNCLEAAVVWLDSIKKFKVILGSCPKDDNKDLSSLPSCEYPCLQNDSAWNKTMELVDIEIKNTTEMCENLNSELTKICVTSESGLALKKGAFVSDSLQLLVMSRISELEKSSISICEKLSDVFSPNSSNASFANPLCHSPVLVDVVEGRQTILQVYKEITQVTGQQQHTMVDMKEIVKETQKLIYVILLSTQNMKKSFLDIDVSNECEPLLEGLLGKFIVDQLEIDSSNLQLTQVQARLVILVDMLKNCTNSKDDKPILHSVLLAIEPFIVEYNAILEQTITSTVLAHRSTTKLAYILSTIFVEVLSKGFCPPSDVEEELSGDKGELKEVEDAGIGEGQGAKDVSDQIEEEDQVEDTPGTESKDDEHDDEEDIPAEDNAIEMSEDFEGKLHDPEKAGDDENDQDEKSDDDNEEELDKQMGELGDDADADKLDERMWGSDDEEHEEEDIKDTKEEKGAGMDAGQSELAAKDEQIGDEQGEKNEKEKEEEEAVDEKKLGDQSEFDPNERDDHHEEDAKDATDEMEIPEDLKLDENENDDGEEENHTGQDDLGAMETEENTVDEPDDLENDSKEDQIHDELEEKDENITDDHMVEEMQDETNLPSPEQSDVDDVDEKTSQEKNEEAQSNEVDENKEENKDGQEDIPSQGNELPAEEDVNTDENTKKRTSRKQSVATEENVQQSESATEQVSQQTKEKGIDEQSAGAAPSSEQKSESASDMIAQNASNVEQNDMSLESERNMGKSDSKRSLADAKDEYVKRVRTVENTVEERSTKNPEKVEAEMYMHVEDESNGYDQQTLDAATDQQVNEQKPENYPENEDHSENKDTKDMTDENAELQETVAADNGEEKMEMSNSVSQDLLQTHDTKNAEEELCETEPHETKMVKRDLAISSIHTNLEHWTPCEQFTSFSHEEIQEIRNSMEKQLREAETSDILLQESERLWQQYLSLTQPLSQQLSEQLRLILEPTQAAKLKGDYRSGRRLNMRKVIPYIASGFRKDKIWLRRSKPSKRAYQVMLAMDDSSSMADNHTKQLAFESLAVISSALSTLEAGQLAVCSFGEDTRILHDFNQPFTDQSGASILQKCSFQQEQTKIAKLLEANSKFMKCAQLNYTSSADPRVSQLLLIISDGRGMYIEGRERVESAVRAARDCGIFIAFVILDNPSMKDSILDIKVPIFKQGGQMPEIRSYMEDFPFPFYVVIRDVTALPDTLSEALRQWFELVTTTT